MLVIAARGEMHLRRCHGKAFSAMWVGLGAGDVYAPGALRNIACLRDTRREDPRENTKIQNGTLYIIQYGVTLSSYCHSLFVPNTYPAGSRTCKTRTEYSSTV